MDKQPVGQLPDLAQSNNDDEIMVITNSEYNQLKKEKISDLITDFTSTNENNALTKGTDGKMFVTDFGNASNITEGTLPVSVLPDIPKDLLPAIETSDLPVSGVSADTYAYPSSVTVNAQGQVTAIEEGTPSGANANTDLSNITEAGKEVIRQTADIDGITEALADKTDMAQAAVASAPSNKRIELTLGASGQSYTLPATGFLCINKTATAANQYAYMQNNTNNAMDVNCNVAGANYSCACWCWGQKGDSITVSYNAAGKLNDFCFVYAEGVKND